MQRAYNNNIVSLISDKTLKHIKKSQTTITPSYSPGGWIANLYENVIKPNAFAIFLLLILAGFLLCLYFTKDTNAKTQEDRYQNVIDAVDDIVNSEAEEDFEYY